MTTYVFDQAWHAERERLAALERIWDPATFAFLAGLGIRPGWRCLEVGAGAGSVARELRRIVGPDGQVLATDLDLRFLDGLDEEAVRTLRHDLMSEPPPEGGGFDLVHARLLVEHLGTEALVRLVASLRPGGLLVVEDLDFASAVAAESDGVFSRTRDVLLRAMTAHGFDPELGRRLPQEVAAAGVTIVREGASTPILRGATPESEFYRLSVLSLRERIADDSDVGVDADELLRRLQDRSWTGLLPTLVQVAAVG